MPKLASSSDVFGDFVKKSGGGEGEDSNSDPQKPNTGDTELDLDGEDWEDWDAEMGIDEADGAQDLRSAFVRTSRQQACSLSLSQTHTLSQSLSL